MLEAQQVNRKQELEKVHWLLISTITIQACQPWQATAGPSLIKMRAHIKQSMIVEPRSSAAEVERGEECPTDCETVNVLNPYHTAAPRGETSVLWVSDLCTQRVQCQKTERR